MTYTCRMKGDGDEKNWWPIATINAQSAAESFGDRRQELAGGPWPDTLTVQVHAEGDAPDRRETFALELRQRPYYFGQKTT